MRSGRILQAASPDGRVSIYDGTLPSPELGPHAPTPATTSAFPAQGSESDFAISGHHCGTRCITGSVIGSVAGFMLLILALICCRRMCQRRRARKLKGDRSLSQIDLLANGESAVQPSASISNQKFSAGNRVFCQMGRCCASGDVIDSQGEEYRVRLFDGSEKTVRPVSLAMNYGEGSTVVYTDPKGGKSIEGTILASNGSFWPPFYQLKPQDPEAGTINTTAACLSPANRESQMSDLHTSTN